MTKLVRLLHLNFVALPLVTSLDFRSHRCCWRMLETQYVDNNFNMLVTVPAILVTKLWHQHSLFFYISVRYQYSKDIANIEIQSPTSTNYHQLWVTKIALSLTSLSTDFPITAWDFMHLWLKFQFRIRSSMLKKPLIFFEPLTRINHWSDPTLVKILIHEVKIMKLHSRWRHSISRLGRVGSFVFLNSLSPECPIMWPINFGPFRKTSNLINNQTCPIIYRGVSI